MLPRILQIVTVFLLILLTACAGGPLDECKQRERAVLAEFPLYGNVSVAPEFNPKHTGCVLAYSASGSPQDVLIYFSEQLEAKGWKGVPQFASGEDELNAYRENFRYGVRVDKGGILNGQELSPDALLISVVVEERSETATPNGDPTAEIPSIEMSEEELEKFVGDYGIDGNIEAVVTLDEGQLQIRRPGRLANTLIPVAPTTFRFEGFPENFLVEFVIEDGEVTALTIDQDFTELHSIGGTMPTHVELERLPAS